MATEARPGSAHPHRRRSTARLAQMLPAATLALTVLVLWQLAARLAHIQPWLLPAPTDIARAGLAARHILGPHTWQTAQETLWGFCLALVVGLGLGVLIELSPMLRRALYPLLVTSQTVPTIAIAPLLAIWLGYGIWPKIIVVGLVCFFPIVVNTADGLRGADPEMLALLRTMGARRRDLFWLAKAPGALPMVFAGVKIAITYSVVGAILGEWVGASRGLGVFMLRSTNSFRTDWVFASIAITAALSVALFGLVTVIERAALRWYYAAGRGERWDEL